MNKIINILITVVLLVLYAGCSDSDDVSSVSTLKVVKSDVEYSSEGGSGAIILETAHAFEVETNVSWCTTVVSGTTINLTVSPNLNIGARNGLIVISTGNEKCQVNITQMGDMADCNIEGEYKFSLLGGTADFEVNTHRNYTVSSDSGDDWLTFTDDNNGKIRVVVASGPYDLAKPRTAAVTVAIGNVKWTGVFQQLPLAGEYSIRYMRDGGTQEGVCRLDITNTPDTYDVRYLSGVPITNGNGLPGKALYTDGKLAFPMGSQLLGYMNVTDYGSLPLYMYAYCKKGNIVLSDDLQYIAPLTLNAKNQVELTFGDNGVWSDDGSLTVDGFYYACVKDGNIVQNWGAMTDVVLTHK